MALFLGARRARDPGRDPEPRAGGARREPVEGGRIWHHDPLLPTRQRQLGRHLREPAERSGPPADRARRGRQDRASRRRAGRAAGGLDVLRHHRRPVPLARADLLRWRPDLVHRRGDGPHPTLRAVFTPEEREALRAELIDRARGDPRISGAAITGSGSVGGLDRWSDIDLGFGVREASDLRPALDDFTDYMRREQRALDTLDVVRDPWIYRVFLLPNTLQVDLAFAP